MTSFDDFYTYMRGYQDGKTLRNIVEEALDGDNSHLNNAQQALLQAAIEQVQNPEFGLVVLNKYRSREDES